MNLNQRNQKYSLDEVDAADLPGIWTLWVDELTFLVKRYGDRAYAEHFGTSIMELRLLRVLHRRPGISQKELLGSLQFEKTATSRLVSSLVDRKLVRRTASKLDGRLVKLTLTASGRELVQATGVFASEAQTTFLRNVLSEDQIQDFLRTVYSLLQEARGVYGEAGGINGKAEE